MPVVRVRCLSLIRAIWLSNKIRVFLIAAFSLAACGPSHMEQMHAAGVPIAIYAPILKDRIVVGQVNGGSSVINWTGVTGADFQEEYALHASGVLSQSPAAARWWLTLGEKIGALDNKHHRDATHVGGYACRAHRLRVTRRDTRRR
jgi:hypothetical protein